MKFDAVLFDCAGVLVDSEAITNGVLRDMLAERGWAMTLKQCMDLHAATHGRIACASGADRFKVEMMLTQVGLAQYFAGRIFSGHEMPRSKPHPDVYLAAAAHLGVSPSRCAVVEDTLTGLAAGLAAGATVFAYVPHGHGQELLAAGASRVFADMAALVSVLQ